MNLQKFWLISSVEILTGFPECSKALDMQPQNKEAPGNGSFFFRRVCLPPKIHFYKKCIKPLDFALKTGYTFFIRYIIIQK